MIGNIIGRMLGADPQTDKIDNAIIAIKTVLNDVMSGVLILLAAVGVFFAIYIAFRLARAEDDSKRKEAKNQLLWAVIGVVGAVVIYVLIKSVFKTTMFPPRVQDGTGEIGTVINTVVKIIDVVLAALFDLGALAGIAFGLYLAIRLAKAEDEGKRKQAKAQMLWTVIAIFGAVILSVMFQYIMSFLKEKAVISTLPQIFNFSRMMFRF